MSSTTLPDATTPLLRDQCSTCSRSTDEETVGRAALNDTDDISDDELKAQSSLEQWNDPRINMWRVFATFFSFVVVGAIDGAYGVCNAGVLFRCYLEPSWVFRRYWSITYVASNPIERFARIISSDLMNSICHIIVWKVLRPRLPCCLVRFTFSGQWLCHGCLRQ